MHQKKTEQGEGHENIPKDKNKRGVMVNVLSTKLSLKNLGQGCIIGKDATWTIFILASNVLELLSMYANVSNQS